MSNAQVHRFRDSIALYVGSGETVYLSVNEALALADAIRSCAADCVALPFTKSAFETKSFTFSDEAKG